MNTREVETFEDLLFKMGIKYVAYHEDNSITVQVGKQWYQIKKVKLNKDGSVRK